MNDSAYPALEQLANTYFTKTEISNTIPLWFSSHKGDSLS